MWMATIARVKLSFIGSSQDIASGSIKPPALTALLLQAQKCTTYLAMPLFLQDMKHVKGVGAVNACIIRNS